MMMELIHRKDLFACFSSFVPFVLSIPFIFVYYLHRLSLYTSFGLILLLFIIHYIVLNSFYTKQVFLRAHFLTLMLTVGFIWSATSSALGLFTIILSIFHLSEYISVGLWCPRSLKVESFLLNHSPQYHTALVLAYLEYFIEKYYFFPNGVPYHWVLIIVGSVIVFSGEYLRKLAMYTARQSFSHLIEDKPNKEHRLITHGIYESYRHPAYVGWFWWACGTQVLLANPICFLIYLIVRKSLRKKIIYFDCLFRQVGYFLLIVLFMKKQH
jgi:protein-S-isoprenylcysteine O-methyltransferase